MRDNPKANFSILTMVFMHFVQFLEAFECIYYAFIIFHLH